MLKLLDRDGRAHAAASAQGHVGGVGGLAAPNAGPRVWPPEAGGAS